METPLAVANSALPQILKLVIGATIVAEVIGVPVAWFRLRSTQEWANRPADVRRIDLLSRYVRRVTGLAGALGLFVSLVAVLMMAVS